MEFWIFQSPTYKIPDQSIQIRSSKISRTETDAACAGHGRSLLYGDVLTAIEQINIPDIKRKGCLVLV